VVYGQMASHELGAIRMSVDYEPSEPTTVQQLDQLERAITAADNAACASSCRSRPHTPPT
jgi:hypothetical protein